MKAYCDMNIFQKIINKIRLRRLIKKGVSLEGYKNIVANQKFLEKNTMENMDYSEYIEYLQIGTIKDVCQE